MNFQMIALTFLKEIILIDTLTDQIDHLLEGHVIAHDTLVSKSNLQMRLKENHDIIGIHRPPP